MAKASTACKLLTATPLWGECKTCPVRCRVIIKSRTNHNPRKGEYLPVSGSGRAGWVVRASKRKQQLVGERGYGHNQLGSRVHLVRRNQVCGGSALGGGYSVFSITGQNTMSRYLVVDGLRWV